MIQPLSLRTLDVLELLLENLHEGLVIFVFNLFMEFWDELYQLISVLLYGSLYLFLASLVSHDEERKEEEQLFLDPLLVIRKIGKLLHDVLQIFLVVHKVSSESEV